MDTLTNKILKITLVVSAAITLSACGSQKSFNPDSGSSDLGSNIPQNAAKAYCSKNIDLGDAKLQVSAYYNMNGQYFPNKFRVKLVNVPSDWKANDYDMVVRLMAASANGTMTPGSSLPFSLERPSNNGYVSATQYQYTIFNVSYDSFGIAKGIGVIAANTNYADFQPQTLFNTVHMVVNSTDTTGAFQVLRLEFRAANGGGVVKYIDTLLPVFHADPKEYAKTHAPTLQALHPLKAYANQGWTQDQYKAFTDQWCF